MPLFRRRKAQPAAPAIDPCQGDRAARWLRSAAEREDWRSTADFFAVVEDPDDRAFYVDQLAQVDGVQNWLREVVAAEPRDPLARVLLGARAVRWAGQPWGGRRGLGRRGGFERHYQRVMLAERSLATALDLGGEDVTAWYQLIVTGRARQLGVEQTRRRFAETVTRHPGHRAAHEQMLLHLARRWGGSHRQMQAFARQVVTRAPEGSDLGHLVAVAHLEQWRDLRPVSTDYLASPKVLGELNAAADRSIRHPGHRSGPGWPGPHNAFALAFSLAGDQQSAAEQFRVIGNLATEFPWNYLGNGSAEFLRRRRQALATG